MEEYLLQAGWQVRLFELRNEDIAYCVGCFACWVKTPGICGINDAGRIIAEEVIQSDLVVFLTPITFGGYSSELKKAVDRIIPDISPFFKLINGEVHHKPRYKHYPKLLGIGVQQHRDDATAGLFDRLIKRNAINLHSPMHASTVIVGSSPKQEIIEKIVAAIAQMEDRR